MPSPTIIMSMMKTAVVRIAAEIVMPNGNSEANILMKSTKFWFIVWPMRYIRAGNPIKVTNHSAIRRTSAEITAPQAEHADTVVREPNTIG